MLIIAASLPILILLTLMVILKWSGARAGSVSWLAALVIAVAFFGMTPKVFVVSQLKGLLFSIYVLAALWPALMLYHLNNGIGGIKALTTWLSEHVADPAILKIILAWTLTGILEGIAGFGLPIAVAAPMLVSLGVPALLAVTASAIGNSWAVSFGNMGMVFQSLVTLSGYTETQIIPYAAVMMGMACLLCGLAVAHVLGEIRNWRFIVMLAVIMSLVQYSIAVIGLVPLSGFVASLVGLITGILMSRKKGLPGQSVTNQKALVGTLASYSILSLITLSIFIGGPIHRLLFPILWKMEFPEVVTLSGFVTPSGYGQMFRWFAHPGTVLLAAIGISQFIFYRNKIADRGTFRIALQNTYKAAFPVTIGIVTTIGLSVMMDHTGMTQLLAVTFSQLTGKIFPLISPIVGMVGAFATGSNVNSNVLFVSLQKQIAGLIAIFPVILIATQTAGGSLGSMIAPAKIIVGCSNVGLVGKEGQVLKRTLPYALSIGLVIGVIGLIMSTFQVWFPR